MAAAMCVLSALALLSAVVPASEAAVPEQQGRMESIAVHVAGSVESINRPRLVRKEELPKLEAIEVEPEGVEGIAPDAAKILADSDVEDTPDAEVFDVEDTEDTTDAEVEDAPGGPLADYELKVLAEAEAMAVDGDQQDPEVLAAMEADAEAAAKAMEEEIARAESQEASNGTGPIGITLQNRWQCYGGTYKCPSCQLVGDYCHCGGLIKHGSWGTVAKLPETCRPTERLIFAANNHQYSARMDVQTDGTISWHAGGRSHSWISLAGIKFVVPMLASSKVPTNQYLATLPLNNHWRAYGGTYGIPVATQSGGVCIVEGLLRSGRWGHFGTLPAYCRPSKRLIFNQNNHQYSSRVDVLTNGQIHWCAGGRSHHWMSLSGIVFSTDGSKQKPLPLASGWSGYGGSYGSPTYAVHDKACVVEGLLRTSTNRWGLLATLPAECRPKKRLIFDANNHAGFARVDVLQNGQIHWVAGRRDHRWISLSGIDFSLKDE